MTHAETVSALLDKGMTGEAQRYVEIRQRISDLTNPVAWIRRRLDEDPWSKQAEIARSVAAHRFTAVQSAHDVGKSYIAARLAAWWIDVHDPGSAFVVSTAPSFTQVRAILWREIAQAHIKGGLAGKLNQTEWHINGQLVAFGRKPGDYDPTAFQGIHARYVLVIIDEACGIPEALWNAADTLVTNEHARILAIGNPDDPESHFAKVCAPGSGWNVIQIDGLESPNFTGEDVDPALRPLLLSPTWVEERKARWGEGSPLYVSKVRGRFPDSAADGVVPLAWARQCMDVAPEPGAVMLGLDVGASTDGDETVIQTLNGNAIGQKWALQTDQPSEIVGAAVAAINETGASLIKVDVIGVGFGIAGWLEEQGRQGIHGARVVRVNVADRSSEPRRFVNLRSELWWMARELSEQGAWCLAGLDDDTLAQLIAPRYSVDAAGRIVVEPKADTKARIGRSPDDADALLLARYVGKVIKQGSTAQVSAMRLRTD